MYDVVVVDRLFFDSTFEKFIQLAKTFNKHECDKQSTAATVRICNDTHKQREKNEKL